MNSFKAGMMKIKKYKWVIIIALLLSYIQWMYKPVCMQDFCFESYQGEVNSNYYVDPDKVDIDAVMDGYEYRGEYKDYAQNILKKFPVNSSFQVLRETLSKAGARYEYHAQPEWPHWKKQGDNHFFSFCRKGIFSERFWHVWVWTDAKGLIKDIKMGTFIKSI